MPKQTLTYRLGYFVDGEVSSGLTEDRRMNTIDSQLRGLYEVLGSGVLSGWEVGRTDSGGLAVAVAPGQGVISFIVVESTASATVSLFPSTTNYIYANRLPASFWDRGVSFTVSLSDTASPDAIPLATVTTSATGVTLIDAGARKNIGLVTSIEDVVKTHRHIGGSSQPQPIDLATQVEGTLSQENIPPLDGSKVTTGKLPKAVIPKVSHVSGLRNQGELTHAQLDTFVQNLSAVGKTVMGETALVNLLQLVLALKHQWPEIDEYLVNHLAFIPGISPDSLIDFDNTTAEVDTRPHSEGGEHKIYGSTGPGMQVYTKTWDSEAEFSAAESYNLDVPGRLMRLKPTEVGVLVDDFESLGNWETKIDDLSSTAGTMELDSTSKVSGSHSAKVGVNTQETSNISFTMRKVFASQDWSSYDRIVFYINTANVEHGDVYFYINDDTAGVQNSYTLVLGKNEPTINRETLLNGWREVTVDLTPYQRSSINTVGFFMSTQYGWDVTRPFELSVDKMTLTTGNMFVSSGYARFIYGNGFPQDFWRIRWDATLPSGTVFKVRARVSNDPADFDPGSTTQPAWSPYGTSSGFELPGSGGTLYSYVQVEAAFEASSGGASSPELMRLYLDRKASADEAGFTYGDPDQWSAGTSFNIDSTSVPGSIKIASLGDADNVFYGGSGVVEQADADMNVVFSSTGASLPLSTRQAIAGEPAGFGQLSAVRRGENDTLWVADTENDRVLQVDKAGNIVFGLWGSFLVEPTDTYGMEESGPGSNTDTAAAPPLPDPEAVPEALYAMYNPTAKTLWVVFNANLETVGDDGTTFDRNKMFLKIGANRVYFGPSTQFSLFGIDDQKYVTWAMSDNQFVKQFTFFSHVLVAELSQADAAAIESVASFQTPSITVSSMGENDIVVSDSVSISFVTPNFKIGGESSDDNGIRLRLNGGAYSYHRTRTVTFSEPEAVDGMNVLEAAIVDGNDNVLDNEEASCSLSFILDKDDIYGNDPTVGISSPRQGQTVSSLPVEIVFVSRNHPILPVGSCVQYATDGGAWVEHRSEDPIQVGSLSGGRHSVSIRLVDGDGNPLSGLGTSATVSFNYGTSADSDLKLLIGSGTIRGLSRAETTKTPERLLTVSIANVYFANLFSPVDLQVIPDETSLVNPSGAPTVLVAKLRSQTTTEYLAPPSGTTSQISAPEDETVIFGGPYLDGHSVIQYSMGGALLFSNNAAKFSDTRANAKVHLGSANKTSPDNLIMADAIRKRAIMTKAELETGETKVIWEYASDRIVADFQLAANDNDEIAVLDSSCDPAETYVKAGSTIVWKNDSSMPLQIVSGTTDKETFEADPDLSLYGDEFTSQELQPGEQYARTFEDGGDFHWFSYPNIVTGIVHVSSGSVSKGDQYMVVEKDPIPAIGGGRVSKIDSWGKIVWSFGDGILYDPRDVRSLDGNSVIISA